MPKKRKPADGNIASDGRTNREVLREFYERIRAEHDAEYDRRQAEKTRHALMYFYRNVRDICERARWFKAKTGLDMPEDEIGWMALAS